MENTSINLGEDLKKELQCPICYEYMKPPISMCENGHSICSNCKPKLRNCPSCRRPFLPTRNRALESLSEMFVSKNTIPKSSESTAKKYNCPFSTISKEDCAWAGSLHDMKTHIKNSHSGRNDTHKSNGRFNVVLTALSPERHYRKAVWSGDDLFYAVWQIKGGNFYCTVLYVGPKKKSSKFTYKFSLTTDNGMKNISMLFRTQSVVTSMEKFFTAGDCVLLHYDTVQKFLNSDKFLHCAFEINPVLSASFHDVNQSKHAASNDTNGETDSLTDERYLLEKEVRRELMASCENLSGDFHPHYSDNSKNGRGGRRGRGSNRGRFNRAARRGAADRNLESQVYNQSGFRDLRNRGRIHARGRSLTDLSDPALYDVEDKEIFTTGKLRNIAHPNRTKVDSSCSSSGPKDEKIDKLASDTRLRKSSLPNDKLLAVRKPQDNLNVSVPTTISLPSLSSVKCASSEQVSTQEKTERNSETKASKVKLPSSETVTGVNMMGKSTGSRHNLNTVPTISQTRDQAAAIYPKIDTLSTYDYEYTDSSPFDTLHDTVQRSVPKGKPIFNQPSSNVSPNKSHVNKDSLNKSASEDTLKCRMCEHFVTVEQTDNYSRLVDIPPPGTNWKCKLCDQWRQ